MGIKAIETKYKGYKFRSRTEARWAVFFDEMNYTWVYEPEGFVIPQVGPYLPDFYLENFRQISYDGGDTFNWQSAFVEVKGQYPKPDEIYKLAVLCEEKNETGYIVTGIPGRDCLIVEVNCEVIEGKWKRPFTYSLLDDDKTPFEDCWHACEVAKSARFEFGQRGA